MTTSEEKVEILDTSHVKQRPKGPKRRPPTIRLLSQEDKDACVRPAEQQQQPNIENGKEKLWTNVTDPATCEGRGDVRAGEKRVGSDSNSTPETNHLMEQGSVDNRISLTPSQRVRSCFRRAFRCRCYPSTG